MTSCKQSEEQIVRILTLGSRLGARLVGPCISRFKARSATGVENGQQRF